MNNYMSYLLNNDDALQAYLKQWSANHQAAEDYYRDVYLNRERGEDEV